MNQNIPIQSLLFFEATARLKSFTKAAEELSVTQSAVSKQIKNLENYFDRQLFDRKYHDLSLTADGFDLFNEIQPRISDIKNSMLSLKEKNNLKIVNIICTHAVAHYFLFPRVILFNQIHSDITINIVSTDFVNEVDLIENDFGILYGNGEFSNFFYNKLFDEEIYPVISTNVELPEINKPEDLLELKLIQLDPKKWMWMNWSNWFNHFGIVYRAPKDMPAYNQVTLALNASLLGLGTTLGWDFMVKEMIEKKLLKRVGTLTLKTGYSDYLVHSKYKKLSKSAQYFREWLIQTS